MDLDPVSTERLALVYPDIAVRWRRVAEDFWAQHKLALRVSEGIRSIEAQAALWAQGRTAPGKIVTYSKPGESLHHYGLAVDACFAGADPFLEHEPRAEFLWREYGRIATSHGLTWGGAWSRFVDRPHVQLTYGLTLQQIKELASYRGNESVWAKCDQMRGVDVGEGWKPKILSVAPAVAPANRTF